VNFMDQVVSSINQFTHGIDKMILRITSVQMFYECLKRDGSTHVDDLLPGHRTRHQHRHAIGIEGTCTCDDFLCNENHPVFPPSWHMFNRFYHFDSHAKDIILHFQEINDRMNKIFLIPCGTVQVNQAFMVNPGHRIVFKLSVWKNDLISVADTTKMAQAIGARVGDFSQEEPKSPSNIDLETITNLIEKQSRLIGRLIKAVKELQQKQSDQDGEPPIDDLPDPDEDDTDDDDGDDSTEPGDDDSQDGNDSPEPDTIPDGDPDDDLDGDGSDD